MAVEAYLAHRWKGPLTHMLGLLAAGVLGQIMTAKGSASYSVFTVEDKAVGVAAFTVLNNGPLLHHAGCSEIAPNRGQSMRVVKDIFVILYKIHCQGKMKVVVLTNSCGG